MKIKQSLIAVCAFGALALTAPTHAAKVTFIAADDSLPTQLCLNAVQGNLTSTKSLMSRYVGNSLNSPGEYVKLVSETLRCNDTDIVDFTAMYGADKTFNYLNRRTSSKYRIDDSVDIIDLSANIDHNIVVMVSAK